MNIGQQLIREREASELRKRIFPALHSLAEEVGYTLNFTSHFLSRLDVRSIDLIQALTSLEVMVRAFYKDPTSFLDREGAVGVDGFVFIVRSHLRQGRRELVFITFWPARTGISRLDLFGRDDIIKIID